MPVIAGPIKRVRSLFLATRPGRKAGRPEDTCEFGRHLWRVRKLLLENRFPRIWVPDPENRDLRQLLWHRHRLVQMRTRIMNQLQALAMNEGYRWKKKLFSEQGRAQLEKLTLAPWASRRRQELLELLRAVTSV